MKSGSEGRLLMQANTEVSVGKVKRTSFALCRRPEGFFLHFIGWDQIPRAVSNPQIGLIHIVVH